MHDIKFIRENPEEFDQHMARRGLVPQSADILKLDEEHRALQTKFQTQQAERNRLSKEIGKVKASGGDADAIMKQVADLKEETQRLEHEEKELGEQLHEKLATLPNLLHENVPDGKDENNNRKERTVGEPTKFSFKPREHHDLGEALGLMDFERATKVSGARFVFLKGALARLERALAQFMLDLHTEEFGYTEISPPLMINTKSLTALGKLPKFSEDLFKTNHDYWMIATSEVVLSSYFADEILSAKDLPIRMCAFTPCFRSEAGAAGRDTAGMIRHHQFYKVELVSFSHPDKSWEEHERMTSCAEEVLKRLKIPYRIVTLCTGDIGFDMMKTYDLEVWLPGQDRYREISSCSNAGPYQAMGTKTRFREEGEKQTEFVHTLNGSGQAVGRCLIAVMENYQQEDGSIKVPDVLQKYMGGMTVIK